MQISKKSVIVALVMQEAFLWSTWSWTYMSNFKSIRLTVWGACPSQKRIFKPYLQCHHLADWAHILVEVDAHHFQSLGQVTGTILKGFYPFRGLKTPSYAECWNCNVWRFSEQNPSISPPLLLSSLCCPLPVPRLLLCVINYDRAGWQHTATVLINYWQQEELFLCSPLSLSLSCLFPHFFSCLIIFPFLSNRRQNSLGTSLSIW